MNFLKTKINHAMFARTGDNQIYGWGSNRFDLLKREQDYCEPQIVEFIQE